MNILLDTCTFLWVVSDKKNLSSLAIRLIAEADNVVYLSAVSVWEIAIKHDKGFLELEEIPRIYIPKYRTMHGITSLPLHEEATFQLHKLPWHHKDPFDRMLISQAIAHQLLILTPDPLIQQYPIQVLW